MNVALRRSTRWVLLICLCTVLTSCSSTRPTDGFEEANLYPGYQIFPTPRTSDAPGQVFRIDKDNVRYYVEDLSDGIAQNISEEKVPQATGRRVFTAKTLGKILYQDILNLDFSSNSEVEFELKLDDVTREYIQDVDLDRVLTQDRIRSMVTRRDDKYYVIRETVSVMGISYKFSRQALTDFGGEGEIESVAEAKANLKWDDSATYQLVQAFDKPHRLFYIAERLVPTEFGFVTEDRATIFTGTISWDREEN